MQQPEVLHETDSQAQEIKGTPGGGHPGGGARRITSEEERRHLSARRPLRTDEQGVVRFDQLTPGTWRIATTGGGTQAVEVAAGTLARAVLELE